MPNIRTKRQKTRFPNWKARSLSYQSYIMTVKTSVRTTNTRLNHFVILASLASSVLALPLDIKVSAPPAIAPARPERLPDYVRTITVTARPDSSWRMVKIRVGVDILFNPFILGDISPHITVVLYHKPVRIASDFLHFTAHKKPEFFISSFHRQPDVSVLIPHSVPCMLHSSHDVHIFSFCKGSFHSS